MVTKRKTPFTKVILNVPTTMLQDFDYVREFQNYSRSEAIKEAMRLFMIDQLPEGMYLPSQLKEVKKQSILTSKTMTEGMAQGFQSLPQGEPKSSRKARKKAKLGETFIEGK